MLKALVFGYGSIGKRHIENLSKIKNMEIIVCTKRKYDKFLKQKNCKIFSSIHDCIQEKPTFAIITNETSYHIKSAVILAKFVIHLLIEKPLSNNLSNTEKLLKIVKTKKLILLIGSNLRFHPSVILMKKMILKGTLGNILSVHVENGSFLPDWHPNQNYKISYSARDELGGGVVLTCIHEIDYLYWLFGTVNDVYSITGNFSNLDINTDDLSSIILKFKNKIIVEAHLDYFQQPSVRGCKIIGTKGTLVWDMKKNSLLFYNIRKKKWITKLKMPNFNLNDTYVDELNHFISCIKYNKKPITDIDDGIYSLKIALAIKKSSKLKKSVSIR